MTVLNRTKPGLKLWTYVSIQGSFGLVDIMYAKKDLLSDKSSDILNCSSWLWETSSLPAKWTSEFAAKCSLYSVPVQSADVCFRNSLLLENISLRGSAQLQ